MALSTATITGDIADHIGNDFDIRRTKIWITTNVPGQTVIDSSADKIRLGSGNVTLAADGTFSAVVWVPGAGSNPASWQTTVHVDYPDRNATNGRAVKAFGPFTITANANLADLVAEMPVQPEYLATVLATVQDMIDEATDGTGPAITALASRVDGYVDHGSISGPQTFNGPTGSHWFDATAATTITLAGFTDGQVASLLCFTGAEDVTVAGLPDLEFADGLVVSAIRARGVWVTGGGGGGTPAVPDSTPPSAVTDLVATGGEGQVSGAWSAATDAENSVSYRWRVWLTSGGATGEWTTTTSLSFLKTGLAAGAYTAEVYAYSAGGASATDTATATVTAAVATLLTETFSRTAGPLIDSPIADSGQTWQHNLYGNTITAGGKLQSNSALTTIPIGGVAQEMTVDFLHGGSGDIRISMGHDGTNTNEPIRQIILTSSGIVSQQTIAGEPTFNISGGTNGYTATGQFTLNTTHTLKVKRTGSTIAVFVDNVKMLEGAANAAAGNYFAFTGSIGTTIDNVVVKG